MNSKLIRGVQYAAWAYFFLYLDINLNRFSLLPNAVGWYLLSRAVTALEEEHPDLRLLGPLTFPLGLWALKQYAFLLPAWDLSQFSWLLSWLALAVELTTLYFHFQFLTDLADIAARHAGETGRDFSPALLRARTVVTVLSTAASVLFSGGGQLRPPEFLLHRADPVPAGGAGGPDPMHHRSPVSLFLRSPAGRLRFAGGPRYIKTSALPPHGGRAEVFLRCEGPQFWALPLAAGALAEAEVPADAEASSWALSSSIRVLTACRRAVTVS